MADAALQNGLGRAETAVTLADVNRLASDKSAGARVEMVTKLVRTVEAGLLADAEREMICDLLYRLAHDTAVQVREAVAWQLFNSPLLSDDLARHLALDVTSVAFPLLRHCQAIADAVLIEVIGQGQAAKQMAIAGRTHLSALVSGALAEVENLAVVATLAGNAGADIADGTLLSMADRYAHVPLVAEPLASRTLLPASVVERLASSMSNLVRDLLVDRHRLSPVIAAEIAAHGRDSATLTLLRPLHKPGMGADALAAHLNDQGRLTVPLLLRSLCAGDFEFFTAGITTRSRVRKKNAAALLDDVSGEGMRALLDHAHVPKRLFTPFLTALAVAQEQGYKGGPVGRTAFQTAALGRLYVTCGQSEERAMDDLLLQLFDQKSDDLIDAAMDQAGLPFIPVRGAVPKG